MPRRGSNRARLLVSATVALALVALVPSDAWAWTPGTHILLGEAVLRSAGVIAMHDEKQAYEKAVSSLGQAAVGRDWIGFTLALKGVFLEGLEVVFIVIAVGGTSGGLPIAVAGGLLAMVVVAAIGVAVRKPLAMVPENSLKYAVGIILTSIGTFWAAEGMGATWPRTILALVTLPPVIFKETDAVARGQSRASFSRTS